MKTLRIMNLQPVLRPAATGLAVASLLALGACATSSRVGQISRLSPYDSPAAVPVAAPPAVQAAPVPAPVYAPAPAPVAAAAPPVQRAMDPDAQRARDAQISAQVLRDQEAADRYEAQRQADLDAARAYSYYATPYPYYAAPYYSPYVSPFPFSYGSVWFGGGGGGRGYRGGGHGRWGGSVGFGGFGW
ncbi:hypothetical protein BH10PSE17_BH10PSE17_04330 [soil metagenome]